MTGCFCAFTSLTMLTVNRYVFICHKHIYHKIYNNVLCIIMCILCWVVAFLFEIPMFIGWGSYFFDQKNHQCAMNRDASFSYAMFVSIAVIGGPVVFMAVLYVLIFRRIWVRKLGVYSLNKDDPLWLWKARRETVRSSKTLFVVFLVFTLCWTPYVIVTSMDMTNSFSEETYLFTTLLVHYHSSLNCIVYILFKR
ncbi:hypothetical protein CHS0354_039678 [Potamilus streckersoni]|uniref:G-protein coupled receptors family 1 profile domain-containing protein n=1 Tax=Potamilus streckersoni TaxID=2493646 RepID=A0AAE0RYJ8_9BIVA|nr:hypothetical protein CHS0354_039678 [Potamilus streckersoni]